MNKKYQIIYADPPWKWETYSKKGILSGFVDNHYKTMTTEDICNLPIPDLCDKNCILFLWATFPRLKDALQVLEAWGFTYKTVGFTWVKLYKKCKKYAHGLGYYTRSNAEICLIGRKGAVKVINRKVKQLVVAERREHSRKPDEVRERIIELVGDLPRIELFAREKIDGWDVWGNEVKSDILI